MMIQSLPRAFIYVLFVMLISSSFTHAAEDEVVDPAWGYKGTNVEVRERWIALMQFICDRNNRMDKPGRDEKAEYIYQQTRIIQKLDPDFSKAIQIAGAHIMHVAPKKALELFDKAIRHAEAQKEIPEGSWNLARLASFISEKYMGDALESHTKALYYMKKVMQFGGYPLYMYSAFIRMQLEQYKLEGKPMQAFEFLEREMARDDLTDDMNEKVIFKAYAHAQGIIESDGLSAADKESNERPQLIEAAHKLMKSLPVDNCPICGGKKLTAKAECSSCRAKKERNENENEATKELRRALTGENK